MKKKLLLVVGDVLVRFARWLGAASNRVAVRGHLIQYRVRNPRGGAFAAIVGEALADEEKVLRK